MFVRDKAKISTMIDGEITGLLNNTELTTMMNGNITYVLNSSTIGTINNGQIGELCDSGEIQTMNNGSLSFLRGKAVVCQQIAGEIKNKSKLTNVIYSQQDNGYTNLLKKAREEKLKQETLETQNEKDAVEETFEDVEEQEKEK